MENLKQKLINKINQLGTAEVHRITSIPMRNLQYWKNGAKLPPDHYIALVLFRIYNDGWVLPA